MCHNKFYPVLLIVYIWIYLIAREADGKIPECSIYEFKCSSDGNCIDDALVCDGLKDCPDGSDESVEKCDQNRTCIAEYSLCDDFFHCQLYEMGSTALCIRDNCKKDEFRCSYGACIRLSAKCDGRADCADNSDETNADCLFIANNFTSFVHCNTNQFQCSSPRKCIDKGLLCDGKGDCDDESDETLQQCENTICSSSEFRCDYGACINASGVCDEKIDCFDASDETTRTCQKNDIYLTPTLLPNACSMPSKKFAHPGYSNIKVNCPKGNPTCFNRTAGQVSLNTVVEYRCKAGHFLPYGKTQSAVQCWESRWIPDFVTCHEYCKLPKAENVDLTCSYKGNIVDCVENMIGGTYIRPRCKAHYRPSQPIHYKQIFCNRGEWTEILFECIPECGKPVTWKRVKPSIANASVEEFGDAPWHVAIYNVKDSTNRQLICGGTLISPYLVLSAAHCFLQPSSKKLNNASDYELVVSKYSRLYSQKDNRYTKSYKIREIILPKDTYTGYTTRHASDIVILWVEEKISLNPAVMPACVPWTEDTQFNPEEGSQELAFGFGKVENGTESKSHPIVQLPFVGRNRCVKSLPENSIDIVTLDKFCAGSENGAGIHEGDSGGGILFLNPDSGAYYLQGIFSVKDDSSSSVPSITNINKYLDWIEEVQKRVQKSTNRVVHG